MAAAKQAPVKQDALATAKKTTTVQRPAAPTRVPHAGKDGLPASGASGAGEDFKAFKSVAPSAEGASRSKLSGALTGTSHGVYKCLLLTQGPWTSAASTRSCEV